MRAPSQPTPDDTRLHAIWRAPSYPRSPRPWLPAALTLVSVALVVAGSLGPWLYIERGPEWAVEVERMRGINTDGAFSLVFAALAAILVLIALLRPHLWILAVGAFVAMVLCSLVGAFDWVIFEPMDLAYQPARQASFVRVEWGLKLITISAPIGAACAFLFARALLRGDY